MLEAIGQFFVAHPLRAAAIGALFLTLYFMRRPVRPAMIAGVLWLLYACWEWLILTQSPDSNIRVDLLLIYPILALSSLWALIRLAR